MTSFFATAGFDATKIEPAAPRSALPEGTYRVVIKTATEKPTKTAGGMGLNFEYQVLDEGAYKGRKLFHWINLKNASAQATEIGQRELASVCRATGVLRPTSSGQFVGKMLKVKAIVEKDRNGELTNRIAEVVLPEAAKPASDVQAVAAAPAQAPGQPAPEEDAPWA